MEYLIKNATIISPDSSLHRKVSDILISRGKIARIKKNISAPKAKIISSDKLFCSIGWCDIGTQVGEPGFEQRETFESLSRAAIAGGFTTIAPFPNTYPPVQNRASVQYVKSASKLYGIDFRPIGAISKDLEGDELAEMLEMHEAGAVAFSDGLKPIKKSGLLLRALQYAKRVEALIIHHSLDFSLNNEGMVHEGNVSTMMGVKGSPSIAEEVGIQRDLKLTDYAESRLMLYGISAKESIDLIKKYKKKDDQLLVAVPYLNLIKTDEDVAEFSSNHKVNPHLRSARDQTELMKALRKGMIDIISSNHVPLEEERKKLEFSYADFGATGLETCFAAFNTYYGEEDIDVFVRAISDNPRKALSLEVPGIKIGQEADLTLFDPTIEWTYAEKNVQSTSFNSPFLNQNLTGRAVGVFKNGRFLSKDSSF